MEKAAEDEEEEEEEEEEEDEVIQRSPLAVSLLPLSKDHQPAHLLLSVPEPGGPDGGAPPAAGQGVVVLSLPNTSRRSCADTGEKKQGHNSYYYPERKVTYRTELLL
ncbi:unnamed protein product [Pleuronectes platessa]|uniref:Uncharacterized protein n=1 Tax=Pleuronectes platessa TaxID=8262 RepID=A0A9N7YRR0_PLEPL|nr:unnamed protein product [Pleuronectes platessa]